MDGTQRYAVTAKKMVHYPDDNSSTLEFPQLTHFDPENSTGHHSRQRGHAVQQRRARLLHRRRAGSCAAAYAEHEEMALFTSYLHVIPDQDLAKTDREVTMTSGNSMVKSVGLEFNNKTRSLKLLSQRQRYICETPSQESPCLALGRQR